MTKTKQLLHWLRLLGYGEAISWLLLLFIAMPLKYFFDQPFAVRITGWLHGILFMGYIVQLMRVTFATKWQVKNFFLGGLASFLPFGTLIFDKRIRKEEASLQAQQFPN